MPADKRKKYHHGDLRNALIEAGMGIIESEGLAELSLRKIAAKVGVSHTAPKNHFGSMRGLMTAIGAEGFRRFATEMRAGLTGPSGRVKKLEAAVEGYIRFARKHPALFQIMFSPEYCDFKDEEVSEAARASYRVLEEISEGLDWDKADLDHAQLRTEIMLWSFAHGYATLLNNGQINFRDDGTPAFDVLDVIPKFGYREM